MSMFSSRPLLAAALLVASCAALSLVVDVQEQEGTAGEPRAWRQADDPLPRALFVYEKNVSRHVAGDVPAPTGHGGEDAQKQTPPRSIVDGRLGHDHQTEVAPKVMDIARPAVIAGVYLPLYVPVIMLWACYFFFGQPERSRAVLLPLTLCALVVGCDVVNQSLSALMSSPMAITAAQSGALVVTAGLWALGDAARPTQEAPARGIWHELLKWSAVAVMFTLYQLVNHLVSYWCSLCERTIFANLCPAVTLLVEMTVMPAAVKVEASGRKKASVATMLLGAVLFCVQYAHFTRSGVAVALLMVAVTIPYRLLQRWLLFECGSLTIAVMACYDGLFLLLPSSFVFAARGGPTVWLKWSEWFSTPSVCLMLVLSLLAFSANHCVSLMMLRCGSATNYLVMHNMANILVVSIGILVFHDKVISSPVMIAGILMSLGGGLWYALESIGARPPRQDSASIAFRAEWEAQIMDCKTKI